MKEVVMCTGEKHCYTPKVAQRHDVLSDAELSLEPTFEMQNYGHPHSLAQHK